MPTFSNLTNGSSTTSFVTASVSPAVNRLILVTVHAYIATGSLPPSTPTVTGNGITYTLEDSTAVDNSGADQSMIWVFRGKLSSASAGAITFSFSGVVPTRCSWIVDQGSSDIDSSGANAANAIVAATKNRATTAAVTTNPVSFVGAMTSGNGAYFACGIENNNSQTPEGTWTQTANQIGTTLIGVSAQYLTTGTDTGTATTWTTAARSGAILLEILAGAVVPPGDTSESKIWTPGFMATTSFPSFLVSLAAPFQRALAPYAGSPVASLPGVIPGVEPEAHAHNPVLKDTNNNLYRLMESDLVNPPAAGNHPLMYKSSDGGITWTDMDSANRPGAVDLEATWVLLVGTQIIVTINRDDTVWFVPFNTSDSGTPDTWGTQETVDTGLSSTGVEQYVSHVRTSDGQYWIFYSDTLATTNQQVAYRRRTAVNTYSAKSDLGGNTAVSYTGPAAVLGAGDVAHVFYTDVTNAHLYYRALTTGGTLSGATQVDSAGTSGFSGSPSRYVNTNPVYYDDAGTEVVSVLYADTSNMLKLVRVVGGIPQTPEAVSASSVLNNPSATTSDAIIAHLAVDGTTTIAVWSDAATGDLLWRRRDAAGTWDAISTLWASGGNAAYYVFPLVFTRAGRRVMGYAYDVGDHPNDISNLRYNEADLGAAAGGGGTVTFDAAASPAAAFAATTLSWSHTCAGTNRVLLVDVSVGTGAGVDPTTLVTSVTYNGVGMTSISKRHAADQAAGYVERFILINPATGANTVAVTMGASTQVLAGGSMSFAGADQTAANYTTTTNASSGSTTPSTITVTAPPTGSFVMAGHGGGSNFTAISATSRYNTTGNNLTGCGNLGGNTAPGAGSNVTLTGTLSAADFWAVVGTVIPAAGGGGSGAAEAGIAPAGATAQATQVKVAKLSGVCSAAAVPTGRAVKVVPAKTTAPAAATATGRAGKVAVETATTTAAATATVVRANSKAETGTAATAATATGRAAKVAVQRGLCSAASSLQGAGRKVTVQAGAVAAAAAGTSRAVKVAAAAAQVGTAGTVQAVSVKRTSAAAQVQAAASTAATCRKLAVAGGRTYAAGFTYWSQVVAPRAVYGVCSAAGLATGRATHVATRSGQVAGSAFTRSAVTKRAAPGGTSSTTGVCQAGGRKRSIVGGSSGAAALLTGAVGKRVGQAGASYVLVLVVGQRRALVSYTPRPDSGTTARPNSGTTVRPNSGITPRPATFT